MKFINASGRQEKLPNYKKYEINWESKSRSKFQKKIKDFLFFYWEHDRVFEEFKIVGSKLTLDFYNDSKKIAVEVQGDQHNKYIEFFHKNRFEFAAQKDRDQKKLEFCENNDIKLVEIFPRDIVTASFFEDKEIYL